MKKVAVLCMVGGLMLASSGAAQAGMSAGLIGGVLATDGGAMVGASARGEWLFTKNFGAEVRAGYLFAPDGTGSAVPIELGAVGVLPLETIELYAAAGGGYYSYTVDNNAPSWADTTPDPVVGFYAATGLRIPLGEHVRLIAEVKFTAAKYSTSDTRTYAVGGGTGTISYETQGGLSGIGANVGVEWPF